MQADSPNETLRTRYNFVVRHGERADHDPEIREQWIGHPDPILTTIGHKQAAETGHFLKAKLEEIEKKEGKQFDKVILECSPFIRTMATAAQVGKAIGKEDIALNCRFSEWFADWLYTVNPCPKLESLNQDFAVLETEFNLQGRVYEKAPAEQVEEMMKLFPESKDAGTARAARNIELFDDMLKD